MRPRPEGRGERLLAARLQRPVAGFNSAKARRSWRTRSQHHVRCQREMASMRPRPEGRGERLWSKNERPQRSASMRPRPEGRGERFDVLEAPLAASELQCGHGPKVVENDDVHGFGV